ncbi:MAG: hypothetical protein KDJ41_14900 [Hyphomicrobiaceae bacterium]|nr:hypothetical protein [Hyphomicrobiaceae bacterium]
MKRILVALCMMIAATAAHAKKAGPNGGMLAGKSGHEIELVVGASELTIYMIDHGKAHSVKGVKLRAIVQQGGKQKVVTLTQVGNEKLVGKLAAPLAKGAIVVVTGKDDHGDALSARFTIK